ncbi:MAG TPA: L-aspartate oxidase [Mariprofundaceae bacterium]|nr:L-aspartate oxidase [Mariprofundaceae bacterium]
MTEQRHEHCDFLIIGSGAAGLLTAVKLAPHGKVVLINKGGFSNSNTYYSQGGIAAVVDEADSVESHVADTIAAGAGLCHEDVVREVAGMGRAIIDELVALGTPFDTLETSLDLTREAAHSHRRVAHVQDATGKAIGQALLRHVDAHANVRHLQNHVAVDLITSARLGGSPQHNTCIGAYILAPGGEVKTFTASHTILATGGVGKVYKVTTNPHAATGDGIAMAWRAGCEAMNMEFMQFHPTCLYNPQGSTMMLTEALRGEGALLVDRGGRRFCFDYHEAGELAPRDVVARAIDHEMKKSGSDCMFLDARPIGEDKIRHQFVNTNQRLLGVGIDMSRDLIPVVPAAHYMCGGIRAGLDGATSIAHLYVIGESACTGLHGANRLASNSLLECLVMAEKCTARVLAGGSLPERKAPQWDTSGIRPEFERVPIKHNWDEIRATMSNYVGIVRSNERLRRARRRLHLIQEEIMSYYWQHPVSQELIELRNLSIVAELIVRCAQQRKESRGLHYSTDYPGTLPAAVDTILTPGTGTP